MAISITIVLMYKYPIKVIYIYIYIEGSQLEKVNTKNYLLTTRICLPKLRQKI